MVLDQKEKRIYERRSREYKTDTNHTDLIKVTTEKNR